jgi:hypothetical protein
MALGDTAASKWIKICINSFEPWAWQQPGRPGQGHIYALLALQVTARSGLILSIATVPDMESHACAPKLILVDGVRVPFRPLVTRSGA